MKKRFVAVRFSWGWCVWDNTRSRFSDGVYADRQDAIDVAHAMNEGMARGDAWGDRDWFDKQGAIFEDEPPNQ